MRVVVLVACLFQFAAFAEQVVFSTSSVKPWGYTDERGQAQGLLVDFSERVSELAGYELVNSIRPYPRVIRDLTAGSVDFAVMFASPGAEQIGIDLGKILDLQVVAVALKGALPIQAPDELRGKRVGVIRGSRYGPAIDDNPHISRKTFISTAQGLEMLKLGRIDVMVATDYAIFHSLDELGWDGSEIMPVYVLSRPSAHLYWSRQSPQQQQADALAKALRQMRSSGELTELFSLQPTVAVIEP
ncbi:substrate-binding periplasmic protein [Aliagarivorans marinus]|uniref:substrate-binding periplasmic protein n=1 Tax=Aliagarivorans marinus TaxID=561965 RepID=UPI0004158066|nr:transporter substrate-binding domain-containing protein [Aliagarivorans marinus]